MNIDINQFHFLRPLFLLLFVILAWFIWRTYLYSKNVNAWSKACDPGLMSYLLVGVEKNKGWLHLFLLFIVGSLIILAMAGPTWSKLPQAVYTKQSASVFVLDLSRSMNAADLKPSRQSLAKLKLIDFLSETKEGLSALIVYANYPHIVSPLTDDSQTIISMVPSLSTQIMPSGGGRADLAIMKAAQMLSQAGNNDGDIVLLTDGVDLSLAGDVAEKVASAGYTLKVVGIGTEQGAPIPTGASGFLKDNVGNIVIPKLNRADLKALALAGSGIYTDISVDNADIEKILKMDFNQDLDKGLNKNMPFVRQVDLWRDQGHWFLLLALPFAALGFRKGWLGMLIVVTMILPQQNAYALGWDELWINKNQQAKKALNEGDASSAAALFENNEWKGVAEYKAGDFEKAEAQFLKSDTADSYYNLGNALARQGKFQEALEAYNNTLERDPEHRDAGFNKTLLQEIIDNQKSDQQQSDESSSPNDESKNQALKDSQDKDSQNKDSQNKDSQNKDKQDKNQQQDNETGDQESDENGEQNPETESEKNQDPSEQQKETEQDDKSKNKQNQDAQAKGVKQQENEDKDNDQKKEAEKKEIEQATEQWLRRIPDDPGGLLREKMRRQNIRDRQRQRTNTENQW